MNDLMRHTLSNMGLLLSLVAIYGVFPIKEYQLNTANKRVLIGFTIGLISSLLTLISLDSNQYLDIDSRNALFCISSLFFGSFASMLGFLIQFVIQYIFMKIDFYHLFGLLVSIITGICFYYYHARNIKEKRTFLYYSSFQLCFIGFINVLLILLIKYIAFTMFNRESVLNYTELSLYLIIYPLIILLIGLQLIRVFKREEMIRLILEQRFLFNALFNSQSIGLILHSPEYKWYEINHYYCSLLGYNEYELEGTNWGDLTLSEDFRTESVLYKQLSNDEIDHYSIEKRVIKKNGIVVFFLSNLVRFIGKDLKPVHLICTSEITFIKHKQKKIESKSIRMEMIQSQLENIKRYRV